MTAFAIVGFSSTDFVPGFVGQTVFGAGQLSASDVPIKLHLIGNKTSAGTRTANQDTDPVFSETEAETFWGPGAELTRMAAGALLIPGVQIYGSAVSDPGGTAATMTIAIATNATGDGGTFVYFIGGVRVEVPYASGETAITTIADRVASRINTNTKLPCTAANSSGTVTLTMKQTGPRGNDIIVRQDISGAPAASGTTSTLGGGSAVSGLGRKFGSGATADDLTTVATNTFPGWYQRVALAARDATQLGVWETSMDSKAGPLEGRPQHTVASVNGTLAAAQSLSQTTLNNPRFQLLWMLNGETDPAVVGATFAALRAVTEQGDPGASYDGAVLPGVAPHTRDVDKPQRATKVSALQTGVTPITTEDSSAKIVRSITTKCLNGSDPDYRTLDTGTAYVPDFIRYDTGLLWTTEYVVSNPLVADDAAPEQPERKSGFATPKRWNQRLFQRLKEHEAGTTVPSGIPQIIDVDLNQPASVFDKTAKRIMSAVRVVPSPRQHQIGVSVLQL